MSTGKRIAGLLLLSTALSFPFSAAAQTTSPGVPPGDDPTTEEAEEQALEDSDPTAQTDEEFVEDDISVPGGNIITVTGRRGPRDVTRQSNQVVSILGAEDIARTGEGDIAGALSRVTGLSVVGNGRVFVRGLGDRYSLAMLNGLPLPSPEPLSRVVPLDIFPTNVVASSLVQKSYSPNFPGEFGGGVINLTTRAVPDESFFEISVSLSGDDATTFGDGLTYYGSKLDWLGFDTGNRDTPPSLEAFFNSGDRLQNLSIDEQEAISGQIFPRNFVTLQKYDKLPVNWSASLTGGTSFEIGDGTYLGVIATASVSNSWRNRTVISQEADVSLAQISSDFTTYITDNNVLVNGLLGVGLEFDDSKVRWTNLYIRDTLKTARLGYGERPLLGSSGFDFIDQQTGWFERQLIDTQLVGEFKLGDLAWDVRAGYAQTDREAPYNATFRYTRTNQPDATPDVADSLGEYYVSYFGSVSDTGFSDISFDDLTEKLYYLGTDLSYPVFDSLVATVGGAYSDTQRRSSSRQFQPVIGTSPLTLTDPDNGSTYVWTPDIRLFQALAARQPGDIIDSTTLALFDIGLIEASDFPVFDAALEIYAGYGRLDWTPTDWINLQAGARFEDAKQLVTLDQSIFTTPITGATETNLQKSYWLPSATVNIDATYNLKLRLAASKTIARPQFRELVEQTYFDPESNRVYRGNPFLVDSQLYNAEARAEYYLDRRGDRITLAGFYKKIDNPIESYITQLAGGGVLTTYANAPEATIYGAEAEAVVSYDLYDWGGFFETKLVRLIANYTYSKSEVKVEADDTFSAPGFVGAPASAVFTDGAQLTGQSDHLVNVQFGLEDTERTQQAYFLFNFASERVVNRGFQGRPPVIEDPGLTVDFVARTDFNLLGATWELEFEARNMFGRDHYEFQDNGTNRIEFNTYRVGRAFSVGLSTEF